MSFMDVHIDDKVKVQLHLLCMVFTSFIIQNIKVLLPDFVTYVTNGSYY